MRTAMRSVMILAVVAGLVPALRAQSAANPFAGSYAPAYELFAGYSYLRAVPMDSSRNRLAWASGGSTAFTYNPTRVVGINFEFGAYHVNAFGPGAVPAGGTVPASGAIYTYMAGPRVSWRHEHWTPFAQVLVGVMRADQVTLNNCSGLGCTPLAAENAFSSTVGAGIDVTLAKHLAWRVAQAEYALTKFRDPTSPTGAKTWQNDARFTTGLVFRLGGGTPAAAPVAAPAAALAAVCTVDQGAMVAGSADAVGVHLRVSNAGGAMLAYSWKASGGSIGGSGADVQWYPTNLGPGVYTLQGFADDGHGGKANCSTRVRVDARPARAPITMTCSSDHDPATAGQVSLLTAVAVAPDAGSLTYTWRANSGHIAGSGATALFDTTGMAPGQYTILGHIADGHGGSADCSVAMTIQPAPVTAPAPAQLEATLALHSIYLGTDQPQAGNAAGAGLVESQKIILRTLAVDFKAYLALKPDARLTLEGHADDRASAEYNQALAERRVALAKSFLVAEGIPAAAIDTHSLGKSDQLDEAQVRQQMNDNPDLTDAERQLLFANMKSIILAQNRRVDVMLNGGGQQSVRRYPFNAKDALTLLSDKAIAQ